MVSTLTYGHMRNNLTILRITFLLLLLAMPVHAQRFIKTVNTLAEALALNYNDIHTNVFIAGRATVNDGFQGIFTYNANSTATTNHGTIFKPSGYSGRFLRQYSGPLQIRWFGAKGDGTTDDTASFTSAATVIRANNGGAIELVGGDNYKITAVPLVALTNINGFVLHGNGSIITTTSSDSTIGLFDFNSSTNIAIRDVRFISPDILPQSTGNTFIRLTYGTKNVLVENLSTHGGAAGVAAYGRVSSLGYDSNRVNGITVLNYTAFGTYYPLNIYGDGLFVRGMKAVNCGRAVFLSNSRDVDVEVESEPGGPFIDVVMNSYVSTNYLSNLENIRLKYRALTGRYATASNQISETAYISIETQMEDAGTNYAIIQNIAVDVNTAENASKPATGVFVFSKYDVNDNYDGSGRGHVIRDITLSGVIQNADILLDAPVRLFRSSTNNWTGDFISNIRIDNLRVVATSANNALEFDGRGIVTNGLPGLVIRDFMTEANIVTNNIRRPQEMIVENSSFGTNRYYSVQNFNTNVVVDGGFTITGTAPLNASGTLFNMGISGTTGTIYTGSGSGNTVSVSSRSASSDVPYWQVVEGIGVKTTRPAHWTTSTTPAQITGNQNDYNPSFMSIISVLRLSTDASRDITGIQTYSGMDGRLLVIHNVGAQDIVLKDASASSATTNRFELNGDKTIAEAKSVMLMYNANTLRWFVIGL